MSLSLTFHEKEEKRINEAWEPLQIPFFFVQAGIISKYLKFKKISFQWNGTSKEAVLSMRTLKLSQPQVSCSVTQLIYLCIAHIYIKSYSSNIFFSNNDHICVCVRERERESVYKWKFSLVFLLCVCFEGRGSLFVFMFVCVCVWC